MPSIFRVGGYVIFFWSNENDEPIHVHAARGDPTVNATKIWLTRSGDCILANNNSRIPQHDLDKIMELAAAQFFLICSKWRDHFCVDEIKFYC